MERNSLGAAAILGITIGLGIAVAGIAVSGALAKSRASQRFVSVKGLAEREVDADLAIWPLTFKEAANDLAELQRRVDERRAVVASFLEGAGFQRSAFSFAAPRITDMQAEGTSVKGQAAPFRYVAQAVVTVRSKDVPAVKKAME